MSGPMIVSSSRGSPTFSVLHLVDVALGEVLEDVLVHEHAVRRHADLPLVREAAEDRGVDGVLEVGVVEDDEGAVAAQLEDAPS